MQFESLLDARILPHLRVKRSATPRQVSEESHSVLGTEPGHNGRLVVLGSRGGPSIPENLQLSDLPTSVADASLFFCLHGDGREILMPPHNA